MGRAAHLLAGLVPSLLIALVLTAPAGARSDAPSLAKRLEQALAVPHIPVSRSSALAVDLATGRVVYARNDALSLLPASNEKLAVAYGALVRLGPAYRFHTDVLGLGRLEGATWRGDLVLKGFGDPTLATSDLQALARDLRALGIRRVTGAILGDESAYDGSRWGPGWKPAFYFLECVPLSALVVDRDLYRGRTTTNPPLAAASLFRAVLGRAGVTVAKRSGTTVAPLDALPLAEDLSQPLASIVRRMGRESDNFMAEMLLKQLGFTVGAVGTTAAGSGVLAEALEEAGVPLEGVRLADGSGLSLDDRLTARSLVALLQAGASDPTIRDAFLGSLAVAGVAGTLEHRLQHRPARGRVIAKTGTTERASALSGFVRDRYVFAVVVNGSPVSTYWARVAQDQFASVLAAA